VLALVLVASSALRRIITLRRVDHWRALRWKEGIILWPGVLFGIGVAVLTAFNATAFYYYRHSPPGNMYGVNGRLMRRSAWGRALPPLCWMLGQETIA
jgi:hypothetical protein